MKPKKFSPFYIKLIAGVILLMFAGYMYYSNENNQYAAFIGMGGILILNAYSMGNKKKKWLLNFLQIEKNRKSYTLSI